MQGSKLLILAIGSFMAVGGLGNVPNKYMPSCVYCSGTSKVQCGKSFGFHCKGGRPCSTDQYKGCLREKEICHDAGYYPYPGTYSQYYKCIINEDTGSLDKVIEECPANSHYVSVMERCMTDREINALKKLWSSKHAIGPYVCQKPGLYADYRDCKNYYSCKMGQTKGEQYVCPVGEFFNAIENKCTKNLSVACAEKMSRKYHLERVLQEARYWELLQYMLNEHEYEHKVAREEKIFDESEYSVNEILSRILFGSKEDPYYSVFGKYDSDIVYYDDETVFSPVIEDSHSDVESTTQYENKNETAHFHEHPKVILSLKSPNKGQLTAADVKSRASMKKSTKLRKQESAAILKNATHRLFFCEEEGSFPDPRNCHMFFYCIKVSVMWHRYRREHLSCGERWFNPYTGRCDDNKPPDC